MRSSGVMYAYKYIGSHAHQQSFESQTLDMAARLVNNYFLLLPP